MTLLPSELETLICVTHNLSSQNKKFAFQETLTFYAPTLQNGKTYSNNSSTFAEELFECVFNHFVELALKGSSVHSKMFCRKQS